MAFKLSAILDFNPTTPRCVNIGLRPFENPGTVLRSMRVFLSQVFQMSAVSVDGQIWYNSFVDYLLQAIGVVVIVGCVVLRSHGPVSRDVRRLLLPAIHITLG